MTDFRCFLATGHYVDASLSTEEIRYVMKVGILCRYGLARIELIAPKKTADSLPEKFQSYENATIIPESGER